MIEEDQISPRVTRRKVYVLRYSTLTCQIPRCVCIGANSEDRVYERPENHHPAPTPFSESPSPTQKHPREDSSRLSIRICRFGHGNTKVIRFRWAASHEFHNHKCISRTTPTAAVQRNTALKHKSRFSRILPGGRYRRLHQRRGKRAGATFRDGR